MKKTKPKLNSKKNIDLTSRRQKLKSCLEKFVNLVIPIVSAIFCAFTYFSGKEGNDIASKGLDVSNGEYVLSQSDYFYSRIFEPLVYSYSFETGEGQINIQGYSFDNQDVKITASGGCIKKVKVIQTNENVESIYGFSSTQNENSIIKDLTVTFSLGFNRFISNDEFVYQYAFVYMEDTTGKWYLDCLAYRYNSDKELDDIIVYEPQDLLRKSYEQNEVILKILSDYESLYTELKNINN